LEIKEKSTKSPDLPNPNKKKICQPGEYEEIAKKYGKVNIPKEPCKITNYQHIPTIGA